jgi:UDP-N-acetylglucosamine--N-acetylmuramyl-(pentapeptide) pyrophosphoryl-undecaprenol N-acetylglucosamine transferase
MGLDGKNIVLAGGGTGGHVIPAIALAEEIVRRGGKARFVGTRDRLEARLVPQAGFEIDFIRVRPLTGGGVATVILGLVAIPLAVLRSIFLLRKIKADAVLGVGGYVAGPVVLAGRLIGLQTALLEQNAAVGLTNKLLARVVQRAFVSYEETVDAFPAGKAELCGNPVKQSILDAALSRGDKGCNGPMRIVVMGGSQGALAIDERVPTALAGLKAANDFAVTHQCAAGHEKMVEETYRSAGITVEVVPFIDDMAATYAVADLVIARSGATTVSELTVMGLPAVLLPYPHHRDKQQQRNAEPMRRRGAAEVLDENLTGVPEMMAAIEKFVADDGYRKKAAVASASLGRPDAARFIIDHLENAIGGAP